MLVAVCTHCSFLACTATTTAFTLRACRALRERLRGLAWARSVSIHRLRSPPAERGAVYGKYDRTAGGLAPTCRPAQPIRPFPPLRQGCLAPDRSFLQCGHRHAARWQKPSQKPTDTETRTGRQKHPARIPLFLPL